MKKSILFLLSFFSFSTVLYSQNIDYVKSMIDTLASPAFYGRGYVNNGDKIASAFIVKQLKKDKLSFFTSDGLQQFHLNVNTFPGKMDFSINGEMKTPGIDYLVLPEAPTLSKTCHVMVLDEKTLSTPELVEKFNNKNLSKMALVVDTGFKDVKNKKLLESPLIILVKDKGFTWDVSNFQSKRKCAEMLITRNALPEKIKKVSLNIEARQLNDYQTQNVVGYIPGKVCPDSFLVFSAHYDHLGVMGNNAYFPGANDNASGTAMLLDLAAHFSKPENQPDYTMVFIFFAGEEAGLLGSDYYTGHPLFSLKKIKFLLNIDMVGTGSDGIKVVNGSVFKPEFERLKALNDKGGYLKAVSPRGEAANSDHYFFYEKGVKCFFIYTLGNEYKEYHSVNDKAAGLPLTKYSELFRLICDFFSFK